MLNSLGGIGGLQQAFAGAAMSLPGERTLRILSDRVEQDERRFRIAFRRETGAETHANLVGQVGARLLVERLAKQLDGRIVVAAVGVQLGQFKTSVERERQVGK